MKVNNIFLAKNKDALFCLKREKKSTDVSVLLDYTYLYRCIMHQGFHILQEEKSLSKLQKMFQGNIQRYSFQHYFYFTT